MNAKICDSCNKTIPEGSSYVQHEYTTGTVGVRVSDRREYYDICPKCHARILDYILNDKNFDPDALLLYKEDPEETDGQDNTQTV